MASLVLSLAEKKSHLLNIYRPNNSNNSNNPIINENRGTPFLHELREILADLLVRRTSENDQGIAEKPLILLGDFNLHHPSWGGDYVPMDREANSLVEILNSFSLNLLLPCGETTWQRRGVETTIDLVFSNPYLTQRLITCQVRKDWVLEGDHYPILIEFDIQPWKRKQLERFALKRLRKKELRQTLFKSLRENQLTPIHATLSEDAELEKEDIEEVRITEDPQEIDRTIRILSTSLREALESSCPKAKPSEYARRGWSMECHELLKDQRRARRRAARTRHPQDYEEAAHLRNKLKQQLRKDAGHAFRDFVAQVANKELRTGDLWRLSKWSRKKAGKVKELPQLPPLRRTAQETPTADFAQKATILAAKFFPKPVQVDLSDLTRESEDYRERYKVSQDVSTWDIEEILKSLPARKAPGPDGIQNEVLKASRSVLAPALAGVAQACLKTGYFPYAFRESNTVVIRKEGKSDYSLPSSYRPIALENTLGKVLERLIAERLSLVLEENHLLPKTQFGARKNRSTATALSLLTETTQTIWKIDTELIVSVLSLDLSAAFDNVSHERLLEQFTKKGLPL